jgi:hypothetical protein
MIPVAMIPRDGKQQYFVLSEVGFGHTEDMMRQNNDGALKVCLFRGQAEPGESPWQTATRNTYIESGGLIDLRTVDKGVAETVPLRPPENVFVVHIEFENERDLFDNFLLDFDRNDPPKDRAIFGIALERFDIKLAAGAKRDRGNIRFRQGMPVIKCMTHIEKHDAIPRADRAVKLRRHVLPNGKISYLPINNAT